MYAYLWDCINQLQKEIEGVKKENAELRTKLSEIQPLVIENIEYKIQELNVDTLSGTLNVGLTTQGDAEGMERMMEDIREGGNADLQLGGLGAEQKKKK
ncbi:spore germination protein GerPC [Mechercharimyces sp. CAU 1602]|uniref:spore germination protein GerPC n=1 Tax=Mechercharimyces sp. CAU 1602 TaxID=2973933 RepID=UPI002161617F|nr:spore germination protein GerPC [Mechercharimyces sp. CAU 1602]MCS1352779.1 spore germination protein GerPC [Mechercharimyces sp. CAU 1602]